VRCVAPWAPGHPRSYENSPRRTCLLKQCVRLCGGPIFADYYSRPAFARRAPHWSAGSWLRRTSQFAALDITTGLVKTGHYPRRRRREFLDFMNEIVADHPGRQMQVVLDNLNTR
jgi:hypothetical protein